MGLFRDEFSDVLRQDSDRVAMRNNCRDLGEVVLDEHQRAVKASGARGVDLPRGGHEPMVPLRLLYVSLLGKSKCTPKLDMRRTRTSSSSAIDRLRKFHPRPLRNAAS